MKTLTSFTAYIAKVKSYPTSALLDEESIKLGCKLLKAGIAKRFDKAYLEEVGADLTLVTDELKVKANKSTNTANRSFSVVT